jgi:hypothetical protein
VTAIESLIEMSPGVAVRFVERQISFSLFAPLRLHAWPCGHVLAALDAAT